ncbi:MAG: hypothetical protein WBA57_07190 [Elainellaceae cyanobacterium]
MDELSPLMKSLTGHPIAFLGGFASGLFRLNLNEDPVKSWLEQRSEADAASSTSSTVNGNGSGPKPISID